MGQLIDFSTSCPWQLYTFAFVHLLAGIFMYTFDVCKSVFPKNNQACVGSEIVMQRMAALSLLYVGVIFSVLTYHNKGSPSKITRLSSLALNGAVAVLVGVIFAGNNAFGGFERSWMHVGDMLAFFIVVGILSSRVCQQDAGWANKIPIRDGLGINCKSLLVLFVIMCTVKILALTDFVDPSMILADGLKLTKLAHYMWNFVAVLVLEVLFGLFFSLAFDDDASHELMIGTIVFMTLVSVASIFGIQDYMSDMYGMNGKGIWIKLGIVVGLCVVGIVGGRISGRRNTGYQGVGEGTSLNV
mmetsp:Transcript_25475/g.55659  ORF Transcript_25475/g.55659 Transcript_25475/m.55659 type:complete len:300 (+) Transcript_25475:985-1884(+)